MECAAVKRAFLSGPLHLSQTRNFFRSLRGGADDLGDRESAASLSICSVGPPLRQLAQRESVFVCEQAAERRGQWAGVKSLHPSTNA